MRTQGMSGKRKRAWTAGSAVESLEGRSLLTLAATQYPLPMILGSTPTSIVAGADGNLWFTESEAGKVAKVSPTGELLREYALPSSLGTSLGSIVAGKDGNLWFSELSYDSATGDSVGKIARLTPDGTVTEFPVEAGATVASITVGPDGNIWFTENVYTNGLNGGRVGRLTPDGKITTFAVPGSTGYFGEITAGADGNLWFVDASATFPGGPSARLGRITTEGVTTEFAIPTMNVGVTALTAGPDGNVWYAMVSYGAPNPVSIGKMTPSGDTAAYNVPGDSVDYTYINQIAAGADGNVWFVSGSSVGKIAPDGTVTKSPVGKPPGGVPYDIAKGPDGAVWYTASDGAVTTLGRVAPDLKVTTHSVPSSTTTDARYGISLSPSNIVRAGDDSLWFTTNDGRKTEIRRVGADGKTTSYDLSTSAEGGYVVGATKGPDGAVWYVMGKNGGGEVGRVAADGSIVRFATPSGFSPSGGIVAGKDGNLWTYGNPAGGGRQILLRVSTSGAMKTFNVPKGLTLSGPMLSGPDGRLWFGGDRAVSGRKHKSVAVIATYDPASRRVSEYAMPKSKNPVYPIPLAAARTGGVVAMDAKATVTAPDVAASPTSPLPTTIDAKVLPPFYSSPYYRAQSMTIGRDGNVWISASAGSSNRVVKMTPRGRTTSYDTPGGYQGASAITTGPDGNVWFSINRALFLPMATTLPFRYDPGPGRVGRITPTGVVSVFTLPDGLDQASSITTGADGNLWFTDATTSRVAKFAPPSLFAGEVEAKDAAGLPLGATNDSTPTFAGSAKPGARITLFALAADKSNVPIGTGRTDASGAWRITTESPIPDGAYTIYGGETDETGAFIGSPRMINNERALVIDGTGPRIAPGVSYDPAARAVTFTVVDSGSGFAIDPANPTYALRLSDRSSYSVTPSGTKKSLNFDVSLAPGATPNATTVTLKLTDGSVPSGPLKLTIKAKALTDEAGNQLDGEYRGPKLPSGNGRAGGDFVLRQSQRRS